jgi:phosphoenolpyruvate-protein phosphotransferase
MAWKIMRALTRRDQQSPGDSARGTRQSRAVSLHGIAVSSGSAIAPTLIYRGAEDAPLPSAASDIPVDSGLERKRLFAALDSAGAELRALAERTRREVGESEGDIFEAQALMLADITLHERLDTLLATGQARAPEALRLAVEEQAAKLEALPDPLWQARAADVRDAARRAFRLLNSDPLEPALAQRLDALTAPVILLAEDLAPSDTAQLSRDRVVGIALARGSATSHAAILARALGIPTVVGLGPRLLAEAHEGAEVVLDTASATLVSHPTESQKRAARSATADWLRRSATSQRSLARWRDRPGALRDGTPTPLLANVGSRADALLAAEYGAEGIGLMRTEFVFAEADKSPTAEEQAATYLDIIAALGPVSGPIIIRTLDAGADKPLRSLHAPAGEETPEANPALGVRGIRLQLARRQLLEAQLRGLALARARTDTDLRVMLPMVTAIEETREVKRTLAAQRAGLPRDAASRPLPIGIMVETPAAVLMAGAFAVEVDFFSVGTNDLTQYVMAGDRLNPALVALIQPLQPAVVRAIAALVSAAAPARRHVSVCGEMAADPRMALLLIGLGVNDLSMNPASIPAVKATLAAYTAVEARALAVRALEAITLADVEEIIATIRVEEP